MTPDDLAAEIAPPPTNDADLYTAQIALSDTAMATGEQLLQALSPGRYRDAALMHLVRAVRAGYAGMRPALVPAIFAVTDPAELPIPHALTDDTGPTRTYGPEEVPPIPGVHVWRWGIQTCRTLHPLARLIGLVLADCCGASGYISPSAQPTLRQLGDRTNLALHAVHQYLGDLVAQGWVTRQQVTRDGVTQARYQLRLPNPRPGRD